MEDKFMALQKSYVYGSRWFFMVDELVLYRVDHFEGNKKFVPAIEMEIDKDKNLITNFLMDVPIGIISSIKKLLVLAGKIKQ